MHPSQHPQQPPVVYVQQKASKATTVGVWILVVWLVGPVLLGLLCCGGLMVGGVLTGSIDGESPDLPARSTAPAGPGQQHSSIDD